MRKGTTFKSTHEGEDPWGWGNETMGQIKFMDKKTMTVMMGPPGWKPDVFEHVSTQTMSDYIFNANFDNIIIMKW